MKIDNIHPPDEELTEYEEKNQKWHESFGEAFTAVPHTILVDVMKGILKKTDILVYCIYSYAHRQNKYGYMGQRLISNVMNCNESTVSAATMRLEKAGHITRKRDKIGKNCRTIVNTKVPKQTGSNKAKNQKN